MRIVILGPPGTGKGSLASLCEKRMGVPYVSTGQIFRDQIARKTELGLEVKRYVSAGKLVPDPLVIRVMTKEVARKRYADGFILDGFPRTEQQAAGLTEALERQGTPIDGALYVWSPKEVLIRRLSGRRVCEGCNANYHIRTMRPKIKGVCDACGGKLIARADDAPDTIRQRLEVDSKNAKPLLDYYRRQRQLHRVDGRGRIETVYKRTRALFRKLGWIGKGAG